MTPVDWLVIFSALVAIAWVNWWFFLAERQAATARELGGGSQELTVVVRGGYEPSRIKVRAGRPVRLIFDRQERDSCSEEIVFPAFGVRRFLPPFRRTAVELPPTERGKYEFTCGMSMLRGTLEVE